MAAIDDIARSELELLLGDLRLAARTIRSETLAERRTRGTRSSSPSGTGSSRMRARTRPGLEALGVWTDALEHADVVDVDLLQELLYGIDALVRVHLWRETGLPLEPPVARPAGDV